MRAYVLLGFICLLANGAAWSGDYRRDGRVRGIIVKYRESIESQGPGNQTAQRLTLQHAGGALRHSKRKTADNADIYYLERPRSAAEARRIAGELMRRNDVEYAEPDYRRHPAVIPNDTRYVEQWYLKRAVVEPGAIDAERAWDDTTGDSSIVIAVIDTGILQHEDIGSGRILAGHDFISDILTANDGNGRDTDPTDSGDFVTTVERDTPGGPFEGCEADDSSWHGTEVSGLIVAETNTLVPRGIAGLDHQAALLPIRALGKCGGVSSDIADAIRWAAGLPVPGATLNMNPADVINLSLGSLDPCSFTEQAAIDAAVAAGVTIVAAAGNDAQTGPINSPANCANVIAVAATTREGAETCFTNVGPAVDLSAPGGNDAADGCSGTPDDLIVTTSNNGATVAGGDIYDHVLGTSFATPLVSGVAALLKGIDGGLSPDAIESVLKTTARAFPTGTGDGFRDCETGRCGAGLLDAFGAVRMAITGADGVPNPFHFEDRSDIDPRVLVASNAVRITGINIPMPVRVTGSGEYSINGGSFTKAEGTISPNQNIRLRLQASRLHDTEVSTRLSIGGVSDTFSVTTRKKSGGGGGAAGWLLPLLIAWRLNTNNREHRERRT